MSPSRYIALLGALLAPLFWHGIGCSRRAEIADEPLGGDDLGGPDLDAGDIPDIDAGLDMFPACADRSPGECVGPVDFPCAVSEWVEKTAERCQLETGCITNGWLEVTIGDDGCVATLGMDQPNDAIVECLAAELGAHSCPCEAGVVTHLFGFDNDGTCPQPCSEEFPCEEPLRCVDAECVP